MMGVLNHLSTLLLLSLLPPALSHVVGNFSECKKFFMEGTTPNLPGILVNGTVQNQGQNQNRYKPICQKFNNIYRFATLYDTTNRIPVFSAYTFTGPPTGPRPNQHWMIEPQLEDKNGQSDMEVDNKAVTHQAANADYDKNKLNLHRGHLFPCSYAPDDETMRSTFTLTNVVPQKGSFNGGRWMQMECRVRKALLNNCKNNNQIEAYVVTGAVPNINNNQLKERVNIPDILWTAFCCKNNLGQWVAGAYWGENKKDNGNILNLETLRALEVKLKESYKVDGNVKVFHDKCPRNVNVQQVESVEEVEPGKKRGREESGEGSNKMERTSGELKECDDEDRWQ
ncbi:endonuclease domain-containing 1 protein-like [Salvelinus alpinus]|uniref:endonuclease domain-containing 1 protein-like n=1 Tax=Salvelinus alpinus TaxID=8036 RepID=UPI0039FC517A